MKFTLISEDRIDQSKTTVEFNAADINVVLVKMKEFLMASGYQWVEGDLEFVKAEDSFTIGDSGDSYLTSEDYQINLDDIHLDFADDNMYTVAGAIDDGISINFAGAEPTVRV